MSGASQGPGHDFDVVICGAGVAGLTLAALLAQQRLRVLLVEKQRQFRMVHKGELLQPRSVELLGEAGLLGPLLEAGAQPVTALACRGPGGQELVSLDYRLLDAPYRHGLVQTYQDMLTTLAGVLGSSVTMWFGSRVTGLQRDRSGRVRGVTVCRDEGKAEIRAGLTVAGDGRGSRLRAAAGIEVEPYQYPHQLVGFELTGVDPAGSEMNAYLTRHGLRAYFGLSGGRARLYAQIPAGSFHGGRQRLPAWADWLVGTVPALRPIAVPLHRGLGTVQVLAAYRFVAPRWTVPGFALIGDAAHCLHPMVGQGMNAAIADAWELAAALRGQEMPSAGALDSALARYEQARRARLEYVASLSHNMATLLTSTSWPARTLRPFLLRRNRGNDRVRRHLTTNVAGLAARPLGPRDWLSLTGLFTGEPSARPWNGPEVPQERWALSRQAPARQKREVS